MLGKFKKFQSKTEEINRLQDELLGVFNPLLQIPFLNGISVQVTIGTAVTLVPHGLARAYQGWFVIDKTGTGVIYRDATVVNTGLGQPNDRSKFIPLKATSSVSVTLWVF